MAQSVTDESSLDENVIAQGRFSNPRGLRLGFRVNTISVCVSGLGRVCGGEIIYIYIYIYIYVTASLR